MYVMCVRIWAAAGPAFGDPFGTPHQNGTERVKRAARLRWRAVPGGGGSVDRGSARARPGGMAPGPEKERDACRAGAGPRPSVDGGRRVARPCVS